MNCTLYEHTCQTCRFSCGESFASCRRWMPISKGAGNLCEGVQPNEDTPMECYSCPEITPERRRLNGEKVMLNTLCSDTNNLSWKKYISPDWRVELLGCARMGLMELAFADAVYDEHGDKIDEVFTQVETKYGNAKASAITTDNALLDLIKTVEEYGGVVEFAKGKKPENLDTLLKEIDLDILKTIVKHYKYFYALMQSLPHGWTWKNTAEKCKGKHISPYAVLEVLNQRNSTAGFIVVYDSKLVTASDNFEYAASVLAEEIAKKTLQEAMKTFLK